MDGYRNGGGKALINRRHCFFPSLHVINLCASDVELYSTPSPVAEEKSYSVLWDQRPQITLHSVLGQ